MLGCGLIDQGDYVTAAKYYQSTLALQEKFDPARERLVSITCSGLLDDEEEPDDTKTDDENGK